MTTYCFASFEGERLLDNRTGLNTAQVGGIITHVMEDFSAFIVHNESTGNIVIRYNRDGDKASRTRR